MLEEANNFLACPDCKSALSIISNEKKDSKRNKEKGRINPFQMFYDLSQFRTEDNLAKLKNDICKQFLVSEENIGRKSEEEVD